MYEEILKEIFNKGGYFKVFKFRENKCDVFLEIGGRVAIMSYDPQTTELNFILDKLYNSFKN